MQRVEKEYRLPSLIIVSLFFFFPAYAKYNANGLSLTPCKFRYLALKVYFRGIFFSLYDLVIVVAFCQRLLFECLGLINENSQLYGICIVLFN